MEDEQDAVADQWYEEKSRLLVSVLGPEHEMVMHSMIPFGAGGGLDLFYFPHSPHGTAIVTKELSMFPGEGSSNDWFDSYELAMFTRMPLDLEQAQNAETAFGRVHQDFYAFLNCIAVFSGEANLNPLETCQFPMDTELIGGRNLLFTSYGDFESGKRVASNKKSDQRLPDPFGLLVLMEITDQELNYAKKNGGEKLLEKLQHAGHYPYSEPDRESVVS